MNRTHLLMSSVRESEAQGHIGLKLAVVVTLDVRLIVPVADRGSGGGGQYGISAYYPYAGDRAVLGDMDFENDISRAAVG